MIVAIRVLVLVLLAFLGSDSLLARVATRSSIPSIDDLSRRGQTGSALSTSALSNGVGCTGGSIFWVCPMRVASPLCFLAELALKVRPDVVDAVQLFLQRIVRGGYDMIFLFERHEHLLYFESGLSEELSAGEVARIEDVVCSEWRLLGSEMVGRSAI